MSQNNRLNQRTVLLINIVLIQVLVVMFNGLFGYYKVHELMNIPTNAAATVSLFAGLALGIISIFLIKEILRLAQKEKEAEVNYAHWMESKALVDVLRTHRHDYLNYLQVVMGSIQLNKSEYAVDYIKEVIDNLKAESSISNLKHPEVAALLLKKIHKAEERALHLEVDMESDLKGLEIPAPDLTRILGNLLDNALDAVTDLSGDERKVEIVFLEDKEAYEVEVFNKRPIIPDEIQKRIFENGFTTKGTSGSGLGLYIVKNLVSQYGGTVTLSSSEEEGTLFKVRFPKK